MIAAPPTLIYPALLAPTQGWGLQHESAAFAIIPDFYSVLLRNACFPLWAAMVAAYLTRHTDTTKVNSPRVPVHEVVALLGFVAAPLIYIVIVRLSHRFFFAPRYGLIAVIGVAGLAAIAGSSTGLASKLGAAAGDATRLYRLLEEGDVSDVGHNLADQLYPRMARNFKLPGHIENFSTFVPAHKRFLAYSKADLSSEEQWLFTRLQKIGYRVTLQSQAGPEKIFEVGAVSDVPPQSVDRPFLDPTNRPGIPLTGILRACNLH